MYSLYLSEPGKIFLDNGWKFEICNGLTHMMWNYNIYL